MMVTMMGKGGLSRFCEDWLFTVVSLFFVFTLAAGDRFINTVETVMKKKKKKKLSMRNIH